MLARCDEELKSVMTRYASLGATNPVADPGAVYAALEECAMTGFSRTPNTLWEEAGRVTFSNKEELQSKVRRYLSADDDRAAVARSMRARVLETHTYRSVTDNLLQLIGDRLNDGVKLAA